MGLHRDDCAVEAGRQESARWRDSEFEGAGAGGPLGTRSFCYSGDRGGGVVGAEEEEEGEERGGGGNSAGAGAGEALIPRPIDICMRVRYFCCTYFLEYGTRGGSLYTIRDHFVYSQKILYILYYQIPDDWLSAHRK